MDEIKGIKWYSFNEDKGSKQKRPTVGKWVVVLREKLVSNKPEAVAIGYMKNAAGDKQCPYFVVPGLGGKIIAWCDCLPESFDYPRHMISKKEKE